MISGASDEELDIAIARANVLLELQPKIDELKKENQELKKQLEQRDNIINKVKAQINHIMQYFDESTQADLILLLIILDNKGE